MEERKEKGFKDLIVWRKSYRLVLEVYRLTKEFPKDEVYCLSQQMRRAAISIPSNISEGYGRQSFNERRQFMFIAYGSLSELETQYLICVDLGYASKNNEIENLMKEIGAMLYKMCRLTNSYRLSPIS